jgi:type VI secretion system protein
MGCNKHYPVGQGYTSSRILRVWSSPQPVRLLAAITLGAEGRSPAVNRAHWCRGRSIVFKIAVLLAAVVPVACSSLFGSGIKTRTLEIDVAPGANADNAVAVDLVFVHDTTLVASFAEMTATNWFKNRESLKLANPTGIEVRSFEVVPGQKGPDYGVRGRDTDAIGAFVFASYDTPGPHRARIDGMPAVLLRLGEKDFTVAVPPSS